MGQICISIITHYYQVINLNTTYPVHHGLLAGCPIDAHSTLLLLLSVLLDQGQLHTSQIFVDCPDTLMLLNWQ